MPKKGSDGRRMWTDEERRAILREAEAASSIREYGKANGIDSSVIYRWRKILGSSHDASTPNGDPDRAALMEEYAKVNGPAGKGKWLKDHGLNRQQIYDWKRQAADLPLRAKRGKPPKVQQQLPIPSPHSILSVDDMINAFKVERDMLDQTIAKMERMRNAH